MERRANSHSEKNMWDREVMDHFRKIKSAVRLNQEAIYEANWLEGSSTLVNFEHALKSRPCSLSCFVLFCFALKNLTALDLNCIRVQRWTP